VNDYMLNDILVTDDDVIKPKRKRVTEISNGKICKIMEDG
jgi:hypothetical protein